MGNRRRTKSKPKTVHELESGSFPLKPDPLKVRLVKRPPPKIVYDLSKVPDQELLDEMRKRGVTKITF